MDKKARDKKGKAMSCSFCGRNYNVVKRFRVIAMYTFVTNALRLATPLYKKTMRELQLI